ncbi:hypothetical protein [Ascidiimonas aurantiaca]|uniref:hypothetical protein n=1 Tax=Ascidiimonas aurantiaca TaxID=1685432 RepID=UPI0030EC7084
MKDSIEKLFESLQNDWDVHEPAPDHKNRFLQKLNAQNEKVISISRKKRTWWKPLSIAASFILLIATGMSLLRPSAPEVSPEIIETQVYFTSLINEEMEKLEAISDKDTEKMVSDAITQMKKLEIDYVLLEAELAEGGNSKQILYAMITNFQTRIDLLKNVLNQIEEIKLLKESSHENHTI